MSSGNASRPGSRSSKQNAEADLLACAASQHLLLYAQRNVIFSLRHDTLTLEHRLEKHSEDVVWISIDNVSERGSGRLAVSYDTGNTAIVWDLHSGLEVTRFVAYEQLLCATFMRDGSIAFGNVMGNLILFEPVTSEHFSARLISDPLTAVAPSSDCLIFACGFLNGSILIVSIKPNFTILHSLSIQKRPSKVTGMQWHGSSQKAKSDMLAIQTADGDMRVWSVPKIANGDPCTAVRMLSQSDGITTAPNWFSWSRNGRIVQFIDKEIRLYDVRTKDVVMSRVSIAESIVGITNYAPSSALFIITSENLIQQWNLNPDGEPLLVRQVQHVPENRPPSPPGSREPSKRLGQTLPPVLPSFTDSEASGDEIKEKSPARRSRAADNDEEQERRDLVGPLSPTSSRSSTSSRSAHRKKLPSYLYDQPMSRSSSSSRDSITEFSNSQALSRPKESPSIRSGASHRSSLLRREVMRSPESPRNPALLDLFPYTNTRLSDLPFRTPDYGDQPRTPDVLRKEMLKIVFGWGDDIETLLRDEVKRHPRGSSRSVLLLKWLGELGSESIVSIMGSQSMTSADWMLLALSSIGKDSQKKAGEAFVQRLLEKGDIHPAVAILLGIGEYDEAIEAYVSQKCFMEALLLTCLITPSNWNRQCFLLRKWGEVAVKTGNPELAVRIFSCTSEETVGTWSSPRAEDAVFKAQKDQADRGTGASPFSPGRSTRFNANNASLRLITTFGEKGTALAPAAAVTGRHTPMDLSGAGTTPIANSALSPDGQNAWLRKSRKDRDPQSAASGRTATPGSYNRRQTSKSGSARLGTARNTPQTASREFASSSLASSDGYGSAHGRTSSRRGIASVKEEDLQAKSPAKHPSDRRPSNPGQLPSPVADALVRLRQEDHTRNGSRDRMPDGLHLDVIDTAFLDSALSPALPTQSTNQSGYSMNSSQTGVSGASSPPLTAGSGKGRALEHYLNSLEQARLASQGHRRPVSRARGESKPRSGSRVRTETTHRIRRDRSASRGRQDLKYIRPPKRSPSSPVAMSPDEVLAVMQARGSDKAVDEFKLPLESRSALRSRSRKRTGEEQARSATCTSNTGSSGADRGRPVRQTEGSISRSASSPSPRSADMRISRRRPSQGQHKPALSTPPRRQRSMSASNAAETTSGPASPIADKGQLGISSYMEGSTVHLSDETLEPRHFTPLSKKELAAKELEERRLSLARRPSAPLIPLPGESPAKRPSLAPRSKTDFGDSPIIPPFLRSQSVDATAMNKYSPLQTGTSTISVPIGLPANPRAMLHGRSMSFASRKDDFSTLPPPVPLGDKPRREEIDGYSSGELLSPLLPSTTYGGPPPLDRSISAPVESPDGYLPQIHTTNHVSSSTFRGDQSGRGHIRSNSQIGVILPTHQHSPPIVTASIDETIHESDVFIEHVGEPPLLPELQHLVEPPPPPLPPIVGSCSAGNSPIKTRRSSLGFGLMPQHGQGEIAIALDPTRHDSPVQLGERASTASPQQSHRRGRGSISEVKTGFGSRIRSVTERMRSTSRSGKKSPPVGNQTTMPSPYETVLPQPFGNGGGSHTGSPVQGHSARGHQRRDSVSSLRTKSPYETQAAPNILTAAEGLGLSYSRPSTASGIRGPSSRPGTAPGTLEENARMTGLVPHLPIGSASMISGPGYVRNPKEVRANMPPEVLQQGGYMPQQHPFQPVHPATGQALPVVRTGRANPGDQVDEEQRSAI
ncbi:hypothetical protein ANO11243_030120 [Dothideomycetidae sp. 11243]|nr:hypothetical protein ANO11243_030120 [fungal sp. No.11243]